MSPYSSIRRDGKHPSVECPNCKGKTLECGAPCKWRCPSCCLNWYPDPTPDGSYSHATPIDGPYNAPPFACPEWSAAFIKGLREYEAKIRN